MSVLRRGTRGAAYGQRDVRHRRLPIRPGRPRRENVKDKEKTICGFYWLERHRMTGAEAYCAVILDRRRREIRAEQFTAASAADLGTQIEAAGWEPRGEVTALCESSVHLVGSVVDRRTLPWSPERRARFQQTVKPSRRASLEMGAVQPPRRETVSRGSVEGAQKADVRPDTSLRTPHE